MKNLIILFLLTAAFQLTAQEAKETKWASFEKDGLSINYPETWGLTEGLMGSVFVIQSPIENETDRFTESVNLIMQDLSGFGREISLKEYVEVSEVQLKNMITDFSPVSSGATTFKEQEAWEMVYAGKQGEYELKWRQLFFIADQKAYVLTYTADMEGYDRLLPKAEEIMETLKWK
jgi:serine/threonine-protein kinase